MMPLALTLVVTLAQATSHPAPAPAPQPNAPPPSAQPSGRSVDETASPEVVGPLVKELGITPAQAEGAAGTLFGVAKTRLSTSDFAKVAKAVPNMEGLLDAAPAVDAKASAVDLVTKKAGGTTSAMSSLSKLGLKPETIVKLTPALVKVVQSRGGSEVASLLAGALK